MEQVEGNSGQSTRLGCGSWLVRGGLGCFSALVGAAAVAFGLAPTILTDFAADWIERGFDARWRGTLEVQDLSLAWRQRQRAAGAVLRDPDGNVVLRGTLEGPTLFELLESWDLGPGGPVQRWRLVAEELDLAVDGQGRSALARALERTEAGRLDVERARQHGRSWWAEHGVGTVALDLEVALERVRWSDPRTGRVAHAGGAAAPPAERVVARDVSARLLLVPGKPAEGLVDMQLAGEGELALKVSFPGRGWWEVPGAPFDLDLSARGLDAQVVASLIAPATPLERWFGERLDVDVRAHRADEGPGRLSELRVAAAAREGAPAPLPELSCSGEFDAPEWTRTLAWSHGRPATRGDLAGVWTGVPDGQAWFGVRVDWPGAEREFGFDLAWDVPALGSPEGPEAPTWSLAVEPAGTLRIADGFERDGPTLELAAPVAQLEGRAGRASDADGDTAGPLTFTLRSDILTASVAGMRGESGLVEASARIEQALGDEPRTPLFGTLLPFADWLAAGSDAKVTVQLEGLSVPADGDPRGQAATGRIELDAAMFRFVPAVARLFGDRGRQAVEAPAGVALTLSGGRVSYVDVGLRLDGEELVLGGHWDRGTRRLDLRMRVPFSLLSEDAVPFLGEYRDLIGAGVQVPLVVRGALTDPVFEVDAAFRADLLEGAVGSMREVVDFLEGEVGDKIAEEALGLLEQVGGLIRKE